MFTAGDGAEKNWLFHPVLGSIGGHLIRKEAARTFIEKIPLHTVLPKLYLGAYVCGNYSTARLPLVTFHQRLMDDLTQGANRRH